MTMPCVVVMGVAGTGKSTVGALLASTLGVPFLEGDSMHSGTSLQKMGQGTPLTDRDRQPWLNRIAGWLSEQHAGAVASCSALRRPYRDILRTSGQPLAFLHLVGPAPLLRERMTGREHFMPASLLASQLSTLEELGPGETGIRLTVDMSPADLVSTFLTWLETSNHT